MDEISVLIIGFLLGVFRMECIKAIEKFGMWLTNQKPRDDKK